MKRLWIISAVVLFAACGATAEITASLEVSAQQDASETAYRRAELTITNSAAATVESILLKPAGIGLAVRYELTVPPGSSGKQAVALPAVSPVQEYALTAMDASGEIIYKVSVPITWPAELVSADAFIDDAFGAWTDEAARLPAKTRRNYLLVLAMFVTAAAATLFTRRQLLRVAAVAVIAGGATVLFLSFYLSCEPEDVLCRYELVMHDAGEIEYDSFSVLSASQTIRFSQQTSPIPYPVWFDRKDAVNDDAVVDPVAGTISLTLHPGLVRIIRLSWRDGPKTESFPRWGSIQRTDNGFTIEADFIDQGSLLIRGDSVWIIEPAVDGRKVSVHRGLAQSYGAFMSGDGGKKLDRNARRLLDYWRDKHRQSEKFYLIEPYSNDDGVRMKVLLLPLR